MGIFWVGMFESTAYKEIALEAVQQLALMTTTYTPDRWISYLVELMWVASVGIGRSSERKLSRRYENDTGPMTSGPSSKLA